MDKNFKNSKSKKTRQNKDDHQKVTKKKAGKRLPKVK